MQKLLLYLCLLISTSLTAQFVPFWSEDFANGIPTTWNTTDGSGQNALWTWCSNHNQEGNEAGCPVIWDSSSNGQTAFDATTADNGFAVVDSDEYGELPQDHVSRLTTSSINCTNRPVVFITFQSHLGTFTYPADGNAILKVSTDGGTSWTSYAIFSGLTTGVRWSQNPETTIIDISATAGGQANVLLQWEWTGNYEYYWALDDIELYPLNPTPPHDLLLGDYFYPVSSYATPESEIKTDTFGFYGLVSNRGLNDQTDVELKAWVTDEAGAILFADSATIDLLPSGYTDSLIILGQQYVPDLEQGKYFIYYAVSADSTDLRPVNNQKRGEFVVTGLQFAKEDAPEQFFRPGTLSPIWYVANYYRMSEAGLDNYTAQTVEFAFTTNDDEISVGNVEASIYLLRVKDEIDDNLDNLINTNFFSSFEWIGGVDYAAPDTLEDNASIQTVQLVDLNTSANGVPLEQGGRYMVAISYANPSNVAFHAFNNDHNYFFNSTLIYTGNNWSTFGPDVNATLRLNLSLTSTTDERPLPADAMIVSPNPVSDQLNLKVNLTEATKATITIADLTGRIIISDTRTRVGQEVLNYSLPQLADGVYLARIATAEGTLTQRFVVAK
jgi:Secretion system C-terminal sorting domain